MSDRDDTGDERHKQRLEPETSYRDDTRDTDRD